MNWRKITAAVLLVGILGNFAVGIDFRNVYAAAPTGIADYIPSGEANMMKIDQTASRTFANGAGRNSADVNQNIDVGEGHWSDTSRCYSPVYLEASADISQAGNLGYFGIIFRQIKFESGRRYIISMPIRKTNGDSVKIGASITNETQDGVAYAEEGERELSESYEKYTFTIMAKADTNALVIGFADGTEKGSRIEIDTSMPDNIFVCEDKAYNITNTLLSDPDEIIQGDTLRLKAEIVNPLGNTSNLSQNISWYAMNEEKTAQVDGFIFSTGENGETLVETADDITPGTYALTAVSDDYDGFVKTVYITVRQNDKPEIPTELPKNTDDYVPGNRSKSFVTDSTAGSGDVCFGSRTSANVTNAGTTDGGRIAYTYTVPQNDTGSIVMSNRNIIAYEGAKFNYGGQYCELEDGKSYVIYVRAKNMSKDGQTAKIGISMNGYAFNNYTNIYPAECPEGGIDVGDEWTDIKGTFTIPKGWSEGVADDHRNTFYIGFPNGSECGTTVGFDMGSDDADDAVYFAEEEVYNITNTPISEEKDIYAGADIIMKAEVINQIGTVGSLSQNFKWYAADEDKTRVAEGFSFKKNGNNTVTVHIDNSVAPGKYAIIAESSDYDGFIKSCVINVKPEKILDTDFPQSSPYTVKITKDRDVENMAAGMELGVSAAVVMRSTGDTADTAQEFDWCVLNKERNTVTNDVKLEVNQLKNAVKIKIDELVQSGEYYIAAKQDTQDGVVRASVKITVDNPPLWEYVRDNLKNMTAEILADKIDGYCKYYGIDFIDSNSYSPKKAAAILLSIKSDKISGEEEFKKYLKRSLALSLFNDNPKNIVLSSASGDFIYEKEIAPSDIDTQNITIWKVFGSYLSETGKKKLQSDILSEQINSFDDFSKAMAKHTILQTIANPSVGGTGYIEAVLTNGNTKLASINCDIYIASQYKEQYNSALARNTYTAQTLEAAIASFNPNTSSSSGGGGGSAPASQSVVSVAVGKTQQNEGMVFADVPDTHWAYSDIYSLMQRKIISGMSDKSFEPDAELTREQFVKMLCIALGIDAMDGDSSYTDVQSGAWYTPWINAAAEKQLINGIGNNKFGVGLPIKRQDMCVIIYNAITADEQNGELGFADSADIADYAREAVAYLSTYGIINGFDDNTFRPQESCTRAQAAKIICSMLNIKGLIEE